MNRLLLVALSFIAAGCGRPAAPAVDGGSNGGPGFPVVITDQLGRTVTIPARPQRIISLSPSATETLFAIGAGPQVVAVTTDDSHPPEAKSLPTVGSFAPATISSEAILGHRPDLIIACGPFHQSVVDSAGQLGLTIVAIDATRLEEIPEYFRTVGKICGQSEEAERLVADFESRRDAVRRRTAQIPAARRPRVLYVLWDDPLQTVGPGTFVGQLIEEAGGVNLFADLSRQYPQISDEEVLVRKPTLILAPDHGAAGLPDRIPKRNGWDRLEAVRSGHIEIIEESLVLVPGPRLILGLESVERIFQKYTGGDKK